MVKAPSPSQISWPHPLTLDFVVIHFLAELVHMNNRLNRKRPRTAHRAALISDSNAWFPALRFRSSVSISPCSVSKVRKNYV